MSTRHAFAILFATTSSISSGCSPAPKSDAGGPYLDGTYASTSAANGDATLTFHRDSGTYELSFEQCGDTGPCEDHGRFELTAPYDSLLLESASGVTKSIPAQFVVPAAGTTESVETEAEQLVTVGVNTIGGVPQSGELVCLVRIPSRASDPTGYASAMSALSNLPDALDRTFGQCK